MSADLTGRVDALVHSVFGDTDLVGGETCLQLLEQIGGERHDIRRLLEAYGAEPTEQISVRKLLAFILETPQGQLETQEWLLPLPPGLYENTRGLSDLYLVITAKGNSFVFPAPGNSFLFPEGGLGSVWTDLEDEQLWLFRERDEPMTLRSRWDDRQLQKLLSEEDFEKARKPRPFSPCLVGHYGGNVTESISSQVSSWSYEPDITIEKDGSVRYYDEYTTYTFRGDDGLDHSRGSKGAQKSSRVKSVSRSGQWSNILYPGPDAHIEAQIPPLCCLNLENGFGFDLGKLRFTTQSALVSSSSISYQGHIKQEDGAECIVSFPGRYPDGWLECVQGSHDMSVACVFLCGKEDGLGEHAVDPEDGAKCYCHKIYGLSPPRRFAEFGFKDQKSCEENGGRPFWGCQWFERWRENVELAVRLKQKLIVYFFAGQVGEGLVTWEELPTAELWDGKGLGGSQKGEVAYLQKMAYDFEMRDVGPFLKDFAATSIRID